MRRYSGQKGDEEGDEEGETWARHLERVGDCDSAAELDIDADEGGGDTSLLLAVAVITAPADGKR